MRIIQFFAIALLLASCQTYEVPKAGSTKLWSAYQVSVPENINQLKDTNVVLWTQDGPLLDSIEFFAPIADGKKLPIVYKPANNKEKAGRFRADMTPEEVVEFLGDSLSLSGLPSNKFTGLRPATFGSKAAYIVDLSSSNAEGANYDGHVLFVVEDAKLWIVFFRAFKTHYYSSRKPVFDEVIKSIQF